jgi:hypothetical protein
MNPKASPDDIHLHLLNDISCQPIFILGLHRSGTSILYKMLGNTGYFNTVQAYHILRYDELLTNHLNHRDQQAHQEINDLLQRKGITNRRIDRLPITADFAQEYVYLFEQKKYDNVMSHKNIPLFKTLCKKIHFISDNDNPILFKNPYDFPNFLFIKRMFPTAKFIFIHRDPLDVISSTMRAWQTLYTKKNPYTALFSRRYKHATENPFMYYAMKNWYCSRFTPGFYGVVHRAQKATAYYLDNIQKLPLTDHVSIRYEALCEQPNDVMQHVLAFLNVEKNQDFSTYIKPRQLQITPEVERRKSYILRKMQRYFKYLEDTFP